ncbi:hypothetical protein GQ54DRAFT_225446 [Martensiomyces pterosporus]|nr:hypothetical protein GQ54DRAFT_225446 [Martensiomyces pterosporus]
MSYLKAGWLASVSVGDPCIRISAQQTTQCPSSRSCCQRVFGGERECGGKPIKSALSQQPLFFAPIAKIQAGPQRFRPAMYAAAQLVTGWAKRAALLCCCLAVERKRHEDGSVQRTAFLLLSSTSYFLSPAVLANWQFSPFFLRPEGVYSTSRHMLFPNKRQTVTQTTMKLTAAQLAAAVLAAASLGAALPAPEDQETFVRIGHDAATVSPTASTTQSISGSATLIDTAKGTDDSGQSSVTPTASSSSPKSTSGTKTKTKTKDASETPSGDNVLSEESSTKKKHKSTAAAASSSDESLAPAATSTVFVDASQTSKAPAPTTVISATTKSSAAAPNKGSSAFWTLAVAGGISVMLAAF